MKKELIINASHPIIKNHQAYGQALLPGLAYIDLLYQFFREHGHSFEALELRNLSIYRPLIVNQGASLRLLLQADEVSKGLWSIQLQDWPQGDSQVATESLLYIKAEMLHCSEAPGFKDYLDFPSLQTASKTQISLHDIYAQCSSQGLIHSGMMKAEGTVYTLDDTQIVEVSLPAAAAATAANFMFHPTLIDGSGVGSSNLFATLVEGEQRLFLPLFYESFRADSLFRQKCIVRVKTASVRRKKDMIYIDLEFFNDSGQKIAELKNFVNKLVRESGFINPSLKKSDNVPAPKPNQEQSSNLPASPSQIDKSESVESMEDLLKQIIASYLECAPDQIDTNAGYYELGMNSAMLLQVVTALEEKFAVKLIPTLLFEYTNIEELAAHLVDENLTNQSFINEQIANPVQANVIKTQSKNEGDIAIIGIAGRYPDANNINEFWQNLIAGKDSIREIPQERWDWRSLAELKSPSGKSVSKWGGFIQDPDCFDHQFFRISPREAEVLDPQERLFLQTCWESIEDAGYTPETLVSGQQDKHRQSSVGVFVGVMHKDYVFLGAEAIDRGEQFLLSLNYASIANRVSYFCDFHGPSMVIDTVCSSSLTALHLALESIRHGESDIALAGGVNLSLHPNKYITYGVLDMYSSDGRCRTFGSGGDGYVSGEGVGAVVLKPLAQAIQDRDHIYAVIKGSTINHVGKVSGISVPNPVAQGNMILQCLEKTGINPRTISYVEAHGTGTSLGDPIEIQGLTKAFKTYTNDTQFCAIGSVKSNIGHTESASGISGLSKVALQLHYKTLVPSLHSQEINPHLDLQTSPFYVQHQTQHWEGTSDYPRRAGLSSFGATGSNAHVILEEYIAEESTDVLAPPTEAINKSMPVLIPLSAKNEERLRASAQNLYDYLVSTSEGLAEQKTALLRDIAYTLQVGRQAMAARLIFLVDSKQQLIENLKAFVDGDSTKENSWQNKHVKQQKHSRQGENSEVVLQQWILEGKLDQIAQAWIQGIPVNWHDLYELESSLAKPARVSLPTYPFAKVRHWVPMKVKTAPLFAALHPLLHRNTSTLSQQRFSSIFSGEEFFLADHQVQGQKILPGVAYLEMARAAVALATSASDFSTIGLKNIIWQQPLVIDGTEKPVHIGLFAKQNSQIGFEIYTGEEDSSGDSFPNQQNRTIHCQGIAIFKIPDSESYLDLEDLQQKTDHNHFTPDQCYQAFMAMGIDYGEGHQGIAAVHVGNDQILAELSLPASVLDNHQQFGLHPSLLDSALQAAIGFALGTQTSDAEPQTSLPYALETLEIKSKCSTDLWVWIRYADNNKAGSPIQKFDLDLCDDSGKICVLMRGFSSRVFSAQEATLPPLLHPLLHQKLRTDNSASDSFISRFTGAEFFLRDHQQVMLGAAYLEMAGAAGQLSMGQKILGLKNIVWNQLLFIAGTDRDVFVQLYQEGEPLAAAPRHRFTITTHNQDSLENIHCQGQLIIDQASHPTTPPRLNIQDILTRCPASVKTADCHQLLKSTHGSSLLTIKQLWHNQTEALALLELPDFMRSTRADYLLHPSIMNGAILSSVIFSLLNRPQEHLPMPFVLDRLWIYQEIPERVYAYVTLSSPNKHDIQLVDENGESVVLFQGFTTSIPGALTDSGNRDKNPEKTVVQSNVIYATTQWQESPLSGDKNGTQTAAAPIFILTQENPELNHILSRRWPTASIETLASVDADITETVQANYLRVFECIKTCIGSKPKLIQPIIILVPENKNAYLHAGFAALLKTARFENAKIAGKLIRYAVDDQTESFAELVAAEMELPAEDVEVCYTQTGTRKTKKLNEISDFGNSHEKPVFNADLLHEGDVVWITGGLGGLGQIFVKHLSQIKGLKLILSGRSTLNAARAKLLNELQQTGAEISYLNCDISDQKAVADLVQSIQKKYGKLNGIIHSAGVNQDAYILNKTSAEFSNVLRPKVAGILAIEAACRDIPLNFIVLFSSIAGVFGSIGQVDYATANAFLDSFAEARNLRVKAGKCFGKTISINWPLWRDGGMGVDAQNETLMQKNTGMIALTTDAGLNAFDRALSSEFNQIFVAQGETEKIRSRLLSSSPSTENQRQIPADETETLVQQSKDEKNQLASLTRLLHKDLAAFICRLQKVKPEEIDIDSEFFNYGFDSISFTSFTNYLNEMYGLELMPTLFFEYSNVRSLANSLLENHQEALLKKYKLSTKKATLPSQAQTQVPAEQMSNSQPFVSSPAAPVPSNSTPETRIPVHQTKTDAIAIIGMSGKFPGSENLRDFWHNLENNRDLISEIPKDRWNWRDYDSDHQHKDGKSKIKWGGFLTDIDRFDPLFFGISPVEAELMDPQFRLFLETVWATIEDAGYRVSNLSGSKTAVYVGVTTTDYKDLMQQARIKENSAEYYAMFPFMLANRVSYLLNFRGPSEAIDTACSSSLVAIHRAIESIRQGSCEMALAGGVNIIANPQLVMAAAQGGMLSEDGRCKTFDQSANGYVRGEGVGAILLKPLAKAIADKDSIYAVIRGSAENHGGRATSPTAPNPVAQQELLISAYTQAGVAPETVGYIEAHGTGTPLGDPIEFNGLKSAFAQLYQQNGKSPADKPHCALGSVKTNIGHLEAAAGISGVLKVLLMIKHRLIPGNSHLQEPNPYIQLTGSPFYLAKDTQAWTALHDETQNPIPRRAGVSSFGIGGSNVHLVLEEYVAEPVAKLDSGEPALIILSAKNKQSLVEIARNLHEFLIDSHKSALEPLRLCDIAYTLQIGREEMEYRLGFVAASIAELEQKLAVFTSTQGENQDLYEGNTKGNKDTLEAFESDDDLQEMLAKWIEDRKFAKILKLWVKGLSVNWNQLNHGKSPRRISLPSYPFARESYWIPASVQPLPIPDQSSVSPALSEATTGVLMCQPVWKEKAAPVKPDSVVLAALDYSQHLILFCEMDAPAGLQDRLSQGGVCHALEAQGEDLALSYQSLCEQVFTHLKEILANKPKGKVFVQIVIPSPRKDDNQGASCLFTGLAALLKTAHLENPKIIGQLIEIDTDDQLIQRLQENSQSPADVQVRYRHGRREVISWEEIPFSEPKLPHIPWKEGGVYLITGGAGGLGLIFAREIARRVQNPTIILSGRSGLSQEKQSQLQQEAKLLGARIEYRQTDVSQQKQVDELIQGILCDFAKLDGILHAAGLIRDSFMIQKIAAQFQQVLAPKVCGTVYLDQASKEINLDFFILFSSGVAVLGNAGQADYAAANAFMDAYADYRHGLFVANQRFGRSLSINWPLWQEGGMNVDEQTLKALEQNSGIKALQTDSGVEALFRALSLKSNQVMVVEGNVTKIRQGLLAASTEVRHDESASANFVVDEKRLLAKTLHQCKLLFGSIIKLAADRIETEEPLERYGIDSMIISQMNHHLAGIFGEISKTLLYEYQTLGELASYLTTEYKKECLTWTGLAVDSTTDKAGGRRQEAEGKENKKLQVLQDKDFITPASPQQLTPLPSEPIAIIGLAGRYAQAKTPQDYWDNLQSGKDCVTEIPPERWSVEGFYHENVEEAITQGKSYSKWGSFIDGFADFDPLFFAISPRETMGIDPQERLFLQSAWEAIEDAGYTRETLRDQFQQRVGVFVGITKTGFNLYGPELWQRGEIVYPHTSFSSVANRISYILNLRGPSLPIDTMCSSSLTAIHEACEHIRRGECELAIAGGVNLYLHPSSYVQMCAAQMLSEDGKCKSFGQGGNGFVPGEGVGAVLLKPLTQAISDRDHIYAVIRGSSVNHGGKTNGYTIPNPNAQAELIAETLNKAGVDARTISYIEAHGTGTALGDPIEISGLTKAFQQHTNATNFCALGSAKSNLGHLEAAAGVAGLTKIILQLKHGQIAPSLHATELNSNINFAKTPFVLQQTLSSWERPLIDIDGETKEYPRRAGISSFGAGGSNAHLIVEEYIAETREGDYEGLDNDAQIVILSAKNEDRLYCAAKNLHDYLNSQPGESLKLRDIAYTLQVGREAMEERLGLIVRSLDELKQKLHAFVARETGIEDMYIGQVKGHKKSLALFTDDDELQEAIAKWIQRRKFAKLVELWSQGLAVDWSKLYREPKPERITLPTYPFEQKKYWIETAFHSQPKSSALPEAQNAVKLHPLIHENTSNFRKQRFSSSFTGQEFFLADHLVQDKRILPGVAYLEMVRMAVMLAVDKSECDLRFAHVVWIRAIVVEDWPLRVHTMLQVEDSTTISFEIYTNADIAENEGDDHAVLHCQGSVELCCFDKRPGLDLANLQNQCQQSHLSAAQCYQVFESVGIKYGPGHQGIDTVYVGNQQVLAKLRLPDSVANTANQFVLHPSLLDSALQASLGLGIGGDVSSDPKPSLPYALESLEICDGGLMPSWSWIRESDHSSAEMQKLDIDLCDDHGQICVSIRGFSSRALVAPDASLTLLHPVWNLISVQQKEDQDNAFSSYRVLVIGGSEQQKAAINQVYPHALWFAANELEEISHQLEALSSQPNVVQIIWIAPDQPLVSVREESLIREQNQGVLYLFRLLKMLLAFGYGDQVLHWTVITTQTQAVRKKDIVNPIHASVHGLIGSLAKEYPHWQIRLLDMQADQDCPVEEMLALPADKNGDAIAYRSREWFKQALVPVFDLDISSQPCYRSQGVYVVIGGAGGIGEVWSRWMIEQYQGQIIWLGRRKKDATIQEKLDALSKLGTPPIYIEADATNLEALQTAYQEIKRSYGNIHGVIHSAIVLADKSLANMDEQQFQAGLKAKVDVSVRLAQVFAAEALDFVLFFSSIQSVAKMPGQSNYAAGCTFKDAFASLMAQEWSCQVKIINWGYWGSVGIVATNAYRDRMVRAGVGSIEPQEGMAAIESLLRSPLNQLALFKQLPSVSNTQHQDLEEWITIYQQELPASIDRLQTYLRQQPQPVINIKAAAAEQATTMEEMLAKLLLATLQSLGLLKRHSQANILAAIAEFYGQWLEESLAVLQRKGYLEYNGQIYTHKLSSLHLADLWQEWDRVKILWLQDSNQKALVTLVETCLRALPEILTGKQQATDVIFPNSALTLVENVYKGNAVADFYNQTLQNSVVAYVQARLAQDPRTQIRILEIGAGTGGTTAGLLEQLRPFQNNIVEYCYTDLSKAFLQHGLREYAPEHPYIVTRIFDVEKPLAEQGIQTNHYDVVIAANVLHATKNIRHTLRNAKATLRKHGLIFLNEMSNKPLFSHLTFGLLAGWWLYEDAALRITGSPALSSASWSDILTEEGFSSVTFPALLAAKSAHDFGQQIIIAQSDGIVRQKSRRQISPLPQSAPTKPSLEIKKTEIQQTQPLSKSPQTVNTATLREKATVYIKKLVASTLQLATDQIDSAQPLETLGLDSILVVQLTSTLRKAFKNISNTLFFEVQTIDGVVDYLLASQSQEFIALLGLEKQSITETSRVKIEPSKTEIPTSGNNRPLLKPDFRTAQRFNAVAESPAKGSTANQDIAIIGLSGRYPQADNIHDFWQNLKAGKNCITEIPQERWDWKQYFDAEKGKEGKLYTKWGGFIDDVDKFDPLFFQLSAREAERMDPQERLFLQSAYNSIEDAGYTPTTLCNSRKVGVFVGVMNSTYPRQPSDWSMANRVSYLFNFQGPSLSVDTACSSSLTALHLAVESLHSGTSECAIVGGVNLILDPIQYLSLSAMMMLSAGNECKSFGDQADGFVDGEGVGAVVLKPLAKAEQDGDAIYGIIKGSMINAGGKTNGYTVPNPIAQSQLIQEALERAGVNPRTVSYLEAHGTGTALGDPIEITGLSKAFGHIEDKQFCAIGSVKSNIGHTESAAGIAGLTKVLLQLQHRQLVPSLHSQQLNPQINFADTPFVVQQTLETWERPVVTINGETRVYPRIAGISSFGAGGANAHVIIQEYMNEDQGLATRADEQEVNKDSLIIVSARDEDRLRELAKNLCLYARDCSQADQDETQTAQLQAIAYTLQVGREAMEERLGLVVTSFAELSEKLQRFLDGQNDVEDLYRGQVKRNKEAMSVLASDEDFTETIDSWIHKRKYGKILGIWVKGFVFDWNKLYGDKKPSRIHLPTYPFARERYWAKAIDLSLASTALIVNHQNAEMIHPLVHKNTSDLGEQRFSSTFSGEEFFLADHRVNGDKMLPGVAYLEMARVAVERSLPHSSASWEKTYIQLQNIIWANPFIFNSQAQTVHIRVFPGTFADSNANNVSFAEIGYEIYSQTNTANEVIVHSQGVATFSQVREVAALDLSALQTKINQKYLSRQQCYDAFKAMGIEYGQGQQGIEDIYVSHNQVLAKLKLPAVVAGTDSEFILHPSIMDSALQACIGLTVGQSASESGQISLPFALDRLEIMDKCQGMMWAWIRSGDDSSASSQTSGHPVTKIDIDLCDESGKICVRIKGFSSRMIARQESKSIATWMGFPVWKEQALSEHEHSEYSQRIVMLCDLEWCSDRTIASEIPGAICIHLTTQAKTLATRIQEISVQVFERIKSLLKEKNQGTTLIQILIPAAGETQLFSALTGLLRTANLENPGILGQLIALESNETQAGLIDKIQRNSHCPEDTFIRYQQEKRQTISWQELSLSEQSMPIPWQEGGVYLITGGLGGLGFIFAKHIAQQTKQVSLILTGISALDQRRHQQIQELESLGAKVDYRQIDVSQQPEIKHLIEDIENNIGSLQGILHSAGIIRDNFIIRKTTSEFQSVLAPKVDGVIHLDEATKDLNLDFFILFSSLAGNNGNVGQVDYACANAFMDAYSHYRNQLVAAKKRFGQTLAINWPLWQEGGMQINPESHTILQNSGLVPMQTKQGIQALIQGLSSGQSQIMVVTGERKRLQASQQPRSSSLPSQINIQQESIDENNFESRSVNYFKNLISSILKIPAHRIQNDELLEQYGIDSVVIMQLTNQLEKVFGSLSKTLFFEYPTIEEISQYFVSSYREKLQEVLGLGNTKVAENHPVAVVDVASQQVNQQSRFLAHAVNSSLLPVTQTQDIAIIGVSGRYPLSPDIETFWENLSQGKNCITEIPKSRWDYNLYFDLESSNSSKANSKWGGFLADVDKFDPLFFNISPREAQLMNPNERLFLETVWDLIERSGYTPARIQEQHNNKVGVYVGAMYQQYQALAADPVQESILSLSSYSAIANRVSYFFDFQGPSMAIDTMCSSSLIAIQLACDSLLKGECQMAIAGGVNLSIHPHKYIGLSLSQMISRQNTSKSFGEGDGYIPGEGVGTVLLKPLAKAIEDGDSILAVIKSINTNHGGHTYGFHVPNPNAQTQLLVDNFRKSGIDPRTITYIESAANGSPLGDPIELNALNQAFQKFTQDQGFCAIGSVKSNIGHAEAASGISQLTKVILQLQHQQLVPSINAEPLNPNLSFDNSPFYLQQKLQPWQRPVLNIDGQEREFPRRATVSSFGAGGSNAHLIVEEYIPSLSKNPVASDINFPGDRVERTAGGDRQLIVFSAKSSDRLQAVLQQMSHFVQSNEQLSLKNMAYTLQVGRMAMTHRIAILVNNSAELIQGIKEALNCLEQNAVIDTSLPVYMGNLEADNSEVKHLLSGKAGEAMMKVLLDENNLEKIALYWVKGGNIPWQSLHKKGQASIISLPTYPFAKRRCWVETNPEIKVTSQVDSKGQIESISESVDHQSPSSKNIEVILTDIMLITLGLTKEEINLNTPLVQYGVDSIMFIQIFQQIKSHFDTDINLEQLLECRTMQEMLLYLKSPRDSQIEPDQANQPVVGFSSTNNILFPELIQMNSSTKGRPVFWFHAVGGVMVYKPVAEKSQRPFYGIQPWSWINETQITSHIQTMVKRYLDAIRSVQPQGPYDFGGYSLGGMFAYEATRQLQELGESVESIVMVDTLQYKPGEMDKYSHKTEYLIALNRALTLSAWQESETTVQEMLINSDQLDSSLSDEEYLTQLIALAKQRGLVKTEPEIFASLKQATNLDEFYQTDTFTFMSLPDPNAVNCYYFRNKNGSMLGDQTPYYFATLEDREKFAITDPLAASRHWQKKLPNIQIIDVDSSSHMTMFSEEKSRQTIIEFCETLYSEK
ncbi:SDR family NAD(P)-dependent oxidoreductase [Anabaena sp. UHCC 0451]|uniref:SDR family NAD(P)-dependent oxidoreductase n=1 Tax=Anabaena sp. UHCC 0451 TaxID=2055235 RepID=UPI000CA34CF4|nr:SDR family NAD(P)-dependent oxidoreductase [Anabaena sp. UHCC 0451]ATX68109.1 malonyl CoA-acyl carrier protein transacylase [Anabaena sp. UHCC 0451]MEA5576032.1 SDR family NAD(P)-dependent oxidoreductase [Anabaena sp. UHCC 0451]